MKNSNSGFTLIEILIAILLLSILMVFVYTIVDNATKTKDTVLSEDAEFLQLESAFARIRSDLENIYLPTYFSAPKTGSNETKSYAVVGFEKSENFPEVTYQGIPIPLFENEESQTISFFSTVNRRKFENSKQCDYVWIKYTLENSQTDAAEREHPDAPYELTRFYNPVNPYRPDAGWDSLKGNLLLRNVKKLEFQFWDSEKKKFLSSLKELNQERYTPRMFKVIITWVDKGNIEHVDGRTIRPLWPKFNALDEQKEINRILQQNDNSSPMNGDPINPDQPPNEGEDGDGGFSD